MTPNARVCSNVECGFRSHAVIVNSRLEWPKWYHDDDMGEPLGS